MQSNSKIVAITGASSGIGKALALEYAAKGYTLFLCARTLPKLEALQIECGKFASQVHIKQVDVRSSSQVREWLETIGAQYNIDIVIANAGTTNGPSVNKAIEEVIDVQEVLESNLLGAIYTISIAADLLLKQQSGRIVIISSLASYVGFPGAAAYCASKNGLRIFCESLQRRLKKTGVGISIVFPGYVDTPMSDKVISSKPFVRSAESAAATIIQGIQNKKSRIGFPVSLWFGVRLLSIMPCFVQNIFIPFFDFKVVSLRENSPIK